MFNDLVIIGQGKVLLFTFNNVIGCGSIVDSMVFRWLSIHDINYRKNLETKKDIAITMSFKNMGGFLLFLLFLVLRRLRRVLKVRGQPPQHCQRGQHLTEQQQHVAQSIPEASSTGQCAELRRRRHQRHRRQHHRHPRQPQQPPGPGPATGHPGIVHINHNLNFSVYLIF